MLVKQIYTIMNNVTTEVLGKSDLVLEDLSNIVDVGKEIMDNAAMDAYVGSLVNQIGKIVFVDRVYSGSAPSVLMDAWEFGSICEKIQADTPEAVENSSWDLVDGQSYDPNVFHKPIVSAKFFNNKVTFEIDRSFTNKQAKQSLQNASQLNSFMTMIYTSVDRSMTIKFDSLVMRTITNMIGETLHSEYATDTDYGLSSGVRAVNLLYLYNQSFGKTLTADKCITDPDFLKFAAYKISLYGDRLKTISSIFNCGGKDRFTPPDKMHMVLLSEFAKAADVYLQSTTFHEQFTALPNAETVPYWQGSGTNYSFASDSKINIKTTGNKTIALSGILGVIFDRDALGVTNIDKRTTTQYNPKGEFHNYFFKFDAGYFNDLNENFVVFFVA